MTRSRRLPAAIAGVTILASVALFMTPAAAAGDNPDPTPRGAASGITFSVPLQYGKGHTLNFCFATCQSRARPCGSTIRKKMISAPTVMKLRCSTVAA